MRCVRQEHASQRTWRSAHTCPMGCDTIPPILLTALPSYEPVTCHLRRCEKRLRAGKPATSYWKSASVSMRQISLEGPRVPCSARCRHRPYRPARLRLEAPAAHGRVQASVVRWRRSVTFRATDTFSILSPPRCLHRRKQEAEPAPWPIKKMVSTAGCSHDLAGQTISPAAWTTGDAP
jgi:hypothetical protein